MEASYQGALEAAGAVVHCFKEFGSYQGDWWAKVTYEGKTGWVTGSYGSCSGCDAIQAEFDCQQDRCKAHEWVYPQPDCDDCRAALAALLPRYVEFGRGYLDPLLTQEEADKKASENLTWDFESAEMLQFIKDES